MKTLIAFFVCGMAFAQSPNFVLENAALNEIDERLRDAHSARQFNGAALVSIGDEVVYEKVFGMAHFEWDVPHTANSRFRTGSVTKQFTAALVLLLVEEGKIDLQNTMSAYFPDYPSAQADIVTVHHLLNHTSGIPSYTGMDEFRDIVRDRYEPEELFELFAEKDLEFEPGSEFSYNNSGYHILGALIERVDGVSYAEALQSRLLGPLGLENTGYEDNQAILKWRASGYSGAETGFVRAPYLDTSVPYSAGMIYSTVGDLSRWTQALHTGKVFKEAATLERMLTPGKGQYGYGLRIEKAFELGDLPVKKISHGGGIHGFRSFLAYYPEKEMTVALIDNTSNSVSDLADTLARIAHEQFDSIRP